MSMLCRLIIAMCMALLFCALNPSLVDSASWSPEDVLKSFLMDNYPWEEIEVSNVRMAAGIYDEAPERIIVEKGPVGRAIFSFVFSRGKRSIVRANVRAYMLVVKSRRPFKRGHVVRDEDVYLVNMDIRKMPNGSVRDISKILGKSLKRSITANIPLVENMVEMSRVVKRGQMVILLIHYKGMSVRAAGKTREKGYVGMPVRAINLSSKKEVNGILIDENTVKVEI